MSEIIFAYGTDILTIPSLELGNIQQLKNGLIEQSNVSGEVGIVKQSYWPDIYRLSFRFNNIRPCDSLAIIDFLERTIGQEITLTDLDGVDWDGVITTPQAEISRGHSDSITIDFEGVEA